MNTENRLKGLNQRIIEVLSKYTDGETDADGKRIHTLKQNEILEKLKEEFGLEYERKAFAKHLKALLREDDRVNCVVTDRKGNVIDEEYPEGQGYIYGAFWFEHSCEKVELDAIIYSIAFARHITNGNKKELIKLIEDLRPSEFQHNLKNYILDDHVSKSEFSDLFLNMELLDSAISSKDLVSYKKTYYKHDKTLYISSVEYIVIPLAIIAGRGDYYLVCCPYALKGVEKTGKNEYKLSASKKGIVYLKDLMKNNPEHLEDYAELIRVDRIKDLKIIERNEMQDDEDIIKIIRNRGGQRNAQEFASFNASLKSRRIIHASFKLINHTKGSLSNTKHKECTISDVIDYFGKANVNIQQDNSGDASKGKQIVYTVYVKTNDASLREFAKANIENVEILTPDNVREELANALKNAYERLKRT